ncbi:MAG: S-layer homology domain-containing protein [Chloroflexia bacterium]
MSGGAWRTGWAEPVRKRSGWLLVAALLAACVAILVGGEAAGASVPGRAAVPGHGSVKAVGQVASKGARDTAGCGWNHVFSPSLNIYNTSNGVAALSANDAWMVGSTGQSGPGQLSLIERWNGEQWSIMHSPDPGSGANDLRDVAAVSPNDIWAVGYYGDHDEAVIRTFVLHWDGNAWSQVPSPNPGDLENELFGVAVLSANDVWAVGYKWGQGHQTLIEHWNGSVWSVVPSPNVGPFYNYLTSVTAVGPSNAWAVGWYSGASGPDRTMVLHWDGTMWNVVPSPNVQDENSYLDAVSAAPAGDTWAVGHSCPGNCLGSNPQRTLVEHWNGSAWTIVPHPNPGNKMSILKGVVALSANDAWAVGNRDGSQETTITSHWDGAAWSMVPNADPDFCCSLLNDVAATSSGDLWAVGEDGSRDRPGQPPVGTLAERYSTSCGTATVTPPPTATHTPVATSTAAATLTPVASPTGAPSATPTLCAAGFTDVQTSDYFYEAVRALACQGVISGYADGTFRPYANTTRGQLCKMVVLAEGWRIYTPPTPTFSDVPLDHPFYRYVETAYNRGIVSGYSGGTFRPGNEVTRGQLCKIVVLAEGWAPYRPPTATFRDVPAGDPFYGYVESAYAHDVVSGYSCGGGCLEFRPGNNATRGQIAKIIFRTDFQR